MFMEDACMTEELPGAMLIPGGTNRRMEVPGYAERKRRAEEEREAREEASLQREQEEQTNFFCFFIEVALVTKNCWNEGIHTEKPSISYSMLLSATTQRETPNTTPMSQPINKVIDHI